jgi:hypothetical protein
MAVRQTLYVALLILLLAASMANLVLALDGIEHPPFIPLALIGGAWFASFATVSLAEEIWPDCL